MNTTDVIRKICSETGIDFKAKGSPDLVPLNDLSIHKTEVWSLAITDTPEYHFTAMSRQYRNRIGYRFRFRIDTIEEGLELCKGLSRELCDEDLQLPVSIHPAAAGRELYLAVHIHPEFAFTPKKDKSSSDTRTLKMCFV